jgi:hypothetical protein
MTIQMLFNPNILEFWQVMMGMKRESTKLYENSSSDNDPVPQLSGGLRNQWQSSLLRQHLGSRIFSPPPTQGTFDKLAVPKGFVGTFQHLFEYLLNEYGTIAIGLYRCVSSSSHFKLPIGIQLPIDLRVM